MGSGGARSHPAMALQLLRKNQLNLGPFGGLHARNVRVRGNKEVELATEKDAPG